MEKLKPIIAKNISDLRKNIGLTQIELAEKLNYTDKAVSKWERGDSVPDVAVLKSLADLFGVTIDYMLTEDHSEVTVKQEKRKASHLVISLLSVMLVWTVATLAYVILGVIPWTDEPLTKIWIVYVYAVPVSAIVLIIFNSIWGNRRRNYLFISVLVWSIFIALFLTLWLLNAGGNRLWMILLLGIPAQIIIILWSHLRVRRNKR